MRYFKRHFLYFDLSQTKWENGGGGGTFHEGGVLFVPRGTLSAVGRIVVVCTCGVEVQRRLMGQGFRWNSVAFLSIYP